MDGNAGSIARLVLRRLCDHDIRIDDPADCSRLSRGDRHIERFGRLDLSDWYTLGTIGFGVSGDRFGRRVMLESPWSATVSSQPSRRSRAASARLRIPISDGLGGGGELSIGSPYVTEVWGRNSRSIGIGIMFVFYPLGYLFSILAFWLVTPAWGWRAVYAFSLVPALIILAMRFRLEELPRFSAVLSELRRTNSRRVGMFEASHDPRFRRRVLVGSDFCIADLCVLRDGLLHPGLRRQTVPA